MAKVRMLEAVTMYASMGVVYEVGKVYDVAYPTDSDGDIGLWLEDGSDWWLVDVELTEEVVDEE